MYAVAGIALDLCEPFWKVPERGRRADVVDKYNGVCTAVVALCDGTESLLACSVPDLKLEGKKESYMTTTINTHALYRYMYTYYTLRKSTA